jgi:hypothetical protein
MLSIRTIFFLVVFPVSTLVLLISTMCTVPSFSILPMERFLYSTNMTVIEHFLPFKELVSTPAAVRDCFGLAGVRSLVAWTLINKRVQKCFHGSWFIGTILSYNLSRQWLVVEYSGGTEEYTASELAMIFYSYRLQSAFFMAFDLVLPAALAFKLILRVQRLLCLFLSSLIPPFCYHSLIRLLTLWMLRISLALLWPV